MRVRNASVTAVIAAAALAGLSGRAMGQYIGPYAVLGSYSFGVNGNAGTDDTGPNQTGNAVTFRSMTIQSFSTSGEVAPQNGILQGEGSPYIVGTLGYRIQTGTGYQGASYASGTTAFYYSPAAGLNYFGQYSPTSTLNYQNNGLQTNYSTGSPSPTFVSANQHTQLLYGENSSGQVIGTQGIQASDSKGLDTQGRNAFIFNIPASTYVGVGLTSIANSSSGASYSINYNYSSYNYSTATSGTSQGTYRFSNAFGIDAAGDAVGNSNRYFAYGGTYLSSSGSTLGTSTWFYNAGTHTTVETGLYGSGYSYQKTFTDLAGAPGSGGVGTFASNSDKGVSGGYQIGTVTPYIDNGNSTGTSLGTEAWLYNSTTNTTTPISMYQSGQTPNIAGFGTSYLGSALSYSYAVTSSVNSATGTYRSSSLTALNSHGQVAGTSQYYAAGSTSSKGSIAWIYTPGTNSYQQVGMTSNGFASGGYYSYVSPTGQQSSTVAFLNNTGASAGTSTEYYSSVAGGTSGLNTTTQAWFTPAGGSSFLIGPGDAYHTDYINNNQIQSMTVTEMTNSGLVAGTASRFSPGTNTSLGSDAWVYDSRTGATYVLDPLAATGITFNSTITYIADNGVVIGQYQNGGTGLWYSYEWTEASGYFEDLTSATAGLASATADPNINILGGSSSYAGAFSYDPVTGQILSQGNYVYQGSQSLPPEGGILVLTPVPEPASLALLTSAAAFGLSRRRRTAR